MSDPSAAWSGANLAAVSALLPSDYTPMYYFLGVVHLVVTSAALVGASAAAKSLKSPTLRSFVRFLPLVSLSFAPVGTRGYWGPALWGLAFGDVQDKVHSLVSIVVCTLVLFVLCVVIHRLARALA